MEWRPESSYHDPDDPIDEKIDDNNIINYSTYIPFLAIASITNDKDLKDIIDDDVVTDTNDIDI